MKKIYRTEENGRTEIEFPIDSSLMELKYGKTNTEIRQEEGDVCVILTYNGDIVYTFITKAYYAKGNEWSVNCTFSNRKDIQNLPYDFYKVTIVKITSENNYILVEDELLYFYNKEKVKVHEIIPPPFSPTIPSVPGTVVPGEPEDEPEGSETTPEEEPEPEPDSGITVPDEIVDIPSN